MLAHLGGPLADQGSGNENVSFYKQKRVSLGSGKHLQIVWRMSKSKNQSPAEAHIDETLIHIRRQKFSQLQPVMQNWEQLSR